MGDILFQQGLYKIEYFSEEKPMRKIIHEEIKSYNNHVSPAHANVRKTGLMPLELYLFKDERLVGGLIGDTYWGWLDIEDLWFFDKIRNQGFGTKLMDLAETEGRKRGCFYSMVKTFSFQAVGFYNKLGYEVVGELKDYPPGESFFWMRKKLK